MRALVDGDIVVYRGAASAEKEEQWVALARADQMIQTFLLIQHPIAIVFTLQVVATLEGKLSSEYKANRPDTRPQHWKAVREFLVTQHKAFICEGFEADDQLGIDQDKENGNTTICSIDKDLLQIPGNTITLLKNSTRSNL